MTSAQQAGFDAWLIKTYLACWKPVRQPVDADVYVAQVRLAYNPDGSLSKAKLVNPPSDPALKPQATSVLAAVQNCNPLSNAGAISPVLSAMENQDHPLRSSSRCSVSAGGEGWLWSCEIAR